MDSRMRRMAVLCATGFVILLVLLILLVNQKGSTGSSSNRKPETETKQEEVTLQGQIGDDLKAFLSDDNFFDPEQGEINSVLEQSKKQVSLMATSVEKDLRISILDSKGNLIKGEAFQVEIGNQGAYTDNDQDGVVYVSKLTSGEYQITLRELEGYEMPQVPLVAKVKDKVTYYPISDISLLIKTEEEIVAANEDAYTYIEKETDRDETEIVEPIEKNSSEIGIDVSKWNGEIDWLTLSQESDVKFAIIRAGYRGYGSGSLVVDPYFEQNLEEAANVGIARGVYFFTQAINEVEAVEEASMVLELLKNRKLQYPIFIDTEAVSGKGRADGLDRATRTKVCEAFCKTIENAGYEAGVYASRSWYQHQLTVTPLEKYHIWLAEYRETPLYEGYYEIWQHTSKGTLPGMNGYVDMNISFMNNQ